MSKIGKICYFVGGLSLIIMVASRYFLGAWIDYLWAPLVLSLLGFVAALAVDYKFYLEFLTMRTTKHGMNMGTLILMSFALAVVVNYGAVRVDKSFDMTEEKLFSLSDQSIKTLDTLEKEVAVFVFHRGEEDQKIRADIKQKLRLYQDSTNKLNVRYVNSFVETELAQKYLKAVDKVTLLVEMDGRRVQIDSPWDEQQVTSALIKVQRTEQKKVYFLSGHGELDIDADERDPQGLSILKKALEASNFVVEKLNLVAGDQMPSGQGAILAIIGPKTQILDTELEAIRKFAREGGSLFVGLDPGEQHLAANLTKPFGVEFKNNYVINDPPRILGGGRLMVIATSFDETNPVTKNFGGRDNYAMFRIASEITRANEVPQGLTVTDLITTDAGTLVLNSLRQKVNEGQTGERVVAVAVEGSLDEKPAPEADKAEAEKASDDVKTSFRGIFVGDGEMASNQIIGQGVNRDFVLNSMAHLVNDAGLISIRPKQPKGTQLTMTSTQQRFAVLGGLSFPLLIFVAGAIVWFRRRGL